MRHNLPTKDPALYEGTLLNELLENSVETWPNSRRFLKIFKKKMTKHLWAHLNRDCPDGSRHLLTMGAAEGCAEEVGK